MLSRVRKFKREFLQNALISIIYTIIFTYFLYSPNRDSYYGYQRIKYECYFVYQFMTLNLNFHYIQSIYYIAGYIMISPKTNKGLQILNIVGFGFSSIFAFYGFNTYQRP